MAENTIEKKFFLDWEGLKALWSKINSTFANKDVVEGELSRLDTDIKTTKGSLETFQGQVEQRFDGVDDLINTFMPREFPTYTDAVKGASMLAPGTVVKVEQDGPLLDESGEPVDDKIYTAGFYMILDPENGIIEKVSTASGAGVGGNIEELAASLEKLSADAITKAVISDETGAELTTVQKENNTLIFKLDNEFKVNSDSVNALTHRAVAAMFGTLTEQITQIPKFKISVVDKLPESEISTSTIYLLKNSDPTANNIYAEYIYVLNGTEGEWEKLGEQSLVIDDFATKVEVERLIAIAMQDVVKTDALNSAIQTAKGEVLTEVSKTYISKDDAEKYIDGDELTASLNNYYTKTEADGKFLTFGAADEMFVKPEDIEDFMTEPEIIVSIQTGNIGDAIRITEEQIESLVVGGTDEGTDENQ